MRERCLYRAGVSGSKEGSKEVRGVHHLEVLLLRAPGSYGAAYFTTRAQLTEDPILIVINTISMSVLTHHREKLSKRKTPRAAACSYTP